jgi:hypothetical protein
VEVLREVLLQLFADDPTLEPRDVLVMCPDIEEFAPLISATFGLSAEQADDGAVRPAHPGQRLRVRLADRSLRQTNPLLSLLAQLLTMADGRVTASEVLDLAAAEPVRRRFAFDDDALDRIRDWAVDAGVRWGENLTRRGRFGLDRVGQGTWEAALDRILLGAAMADENQRFIGTALPLDDDTRRPAGRAALRDVHGVQQLTDGYRRGSLRTGALVRAGVQDDQMVSSRHERVEEQLTVLSATVTLADQGLAEEEVIAVTRRPTRERPVVHAEKTDHPVWHRPHRNHGAHRQMTGAEAGSGRAALQSTGQERTHVRQPQRRVPVMHASEPDLPEDSPCLNALPGVRGRRFRELVERRVERVQPVGQGHGAVQQP